MSYLEKKLLFSKRTIFFIESHKIPVIFRKNHPLLEELNKEKLKYNRITSIKKVEKVLEVHHHNYGIKIVFMLPTRYKKSH